jgi:hypothetical protein
MCSQHKHPEWECRYVHPYRDCVGTKGEREALVERRRRRRRRVACMISIRTYTSPVYKEVGKDKEEEEEEG